MTKPKITFARDNTILINGKRTRLYVRQGTYRNSLDDRLGRWYVGERGYHFRPWGAGHKTRRAAALHALNPLDVAWDAIDLSQWNEGENR